MAMRASWLGCVVAMIQGSWSALAITLAAGVEYRTFAARRTLESRSHFGQVQPQFRHGAAQSVAVHPQFLGRFALVAPVRHQNFAQILPFELAHGILIADAAGMHLRHQDVQFFSHSSLLQFHLESFDLGYQTSLYGESHYGINFPYDTP